MAQKYVTSSGTLIRPGAYAETKVQNNPSGIGTTGVIVLIGESELGPHYTDESDLSLNSFGPDQLSDFAAKYGSGPLVDAFRGAVAASNDPGITGSLSRIIAVKTNTGAKAIGTIPKVGGGNYANLTAKSAGKLGNLITRTITTAQAETVPSTGSYTIGIVPIDSGDNATTVDFIVNGGATVSTTLTEGMLPPAMVSAINGLSGVAATGGADRGNVVDASQNVTVSLTGNTRLFTASAAWTVTPVAGDLLHIPDGGAFTTGNEGSWVISSVTSTTILATKVRDAAGAAPGVWTSVTSPVNETVNTVASADFKCYAPVTISVEAGAVVPGLGKSLEIADNGSDPFSALGWTIVNSAPVATTWNSKSGAPYTISSSTENKVAVNVARQTDLVNETVTVGGEIVFTLGYIGTTGSCTITQDGQFSTTVTGGSGTSISAFSLSDYPTVGDLVAFLNTQTGYVASAGNNATAQYPSTQLDAGTYTIHTIHGGKNGRIKSDGAWFAEDVGGGQPLIDVAAISPDVRLTGLPDVATLAFLSGGSKGGTLAADISGAITALESVPANFIVPLFSRDATLDISAGVTDATSTYTVDAIHSLVRSHCISMSSLKRRKRRQGFCSYKGTFAEAKTKAGNLASSRCALTFQDIRDVDSTGSIKTFQPWMGAVKAAGMQAAGFYRPLVKKFVAISGTSCTGFNDQSDSNVEDALLSGLLPIIRNVSGGYQWESDQTSYSKDENFVFNSIQAIYVSDVVAAMSEIGMETSFVGQSVADISRGVAQMVLEGILDNALRLKLLAPSDGAEKGFKDINVAIRGNAIVCSATIVIGTAIYFVPITFSVIPVQQTA
jgi:hypothetical protein